MVLGIPLYVWYWLIGIIISLVVYIFLLDETSKSGVKNFLKKWGVVIFIVLLWIFLRSYLGYFTEEDWFGRKANTYALLLLLLYGLVNSFLGVLRYKSTQAECDNRSGSCTRYWEGDEYVVLNIGSTDADMIAWPFGHETWVVPKKHFNKINKTKDSPAQIYIHTHVLKSDLTETPQAAHDFIESAFGYNKDNIYYGEFTLDELKSDKKIEVKDGKKLSLTDFSNKLKDTNRLLNESRTMLKGKTSAIKGFVSDAAVIQKKASGRSALPEKRRAEEEY